MSPSGRGAGPGLSPGFGPWGSAALFRAVIGCTLGSIRYGDSFWYILLRRQDSAGR